MERHGLEIGIILSVILLGFAISIEKKIPTKEIHFIEDKWKIDCDVYIDDAPYQLDNYVKNLASPTSKSSTCLTVSVSSPSKI